MLRRNGENRKMQNGLGSQMMQLNSPELQKSMEELRHRKCKTAFHKITEHDGFKCTFKRIILSFAWTPLNYTLSLEKTHILQFLYNRFRHFASTPAYGKIGNSFIFDLGVVLLGSHLNVTSSSSGATRGLNRCHKHWINVNMNLTAARS